MVPRFQASRFWNSFSSPAKQYTYIDRLSGGEKSDCSCWRCSLPIQILILDEPTNDFDIDTLNVLEDFLGEIYGLFYYWYHTRSVFHGPFSRSAFCVGGDSLVKAHKRQLHRLSIRERRSRAKHQTTASKASEPQPAAKIFIGEKNWKSWIKEGFRSGTRHQNPKEQKMNAAAFKQRPDIAQPIW